MASPEPHATADVPLPADLLKRIRALREEAAALQADLSRAGRHISCVMVEDAVLVLASAERTFNVV